MQSHGQTLIKWRFPEFIKPKRTKIWYFWAILIGGGLFVHALITFNYLFALIIIMIALIILLHGKREPQEVNFKITEDGLAMESATSQRFYPYKEIRSFYIIYEPPEIKNLYFQFKSGLRPRLSIPLKNQNPLEVRKVLLKFLEEDLEKDIEPLSEQVGRMLKL